eukprot:gene2319-3159_t
MGCTSSNAVDKDGGQTEGLTNPIGEEAYNTLITLSQEAKPAAPSAPEGLSEQVQLDKLLFSLTEQVEDQKLVHKGLLEDMLSSVKIESAEPLINASVVLSMAPMVSEVDSEGYCSMYREQLRPKIELMGVTMSEMSPSAVSGLDFFEWTQESTIKLDNPDAEFHFQQLEIHGMRNEPREPKRKTMYYGFNVTCLASGAKVFEVMLPAIRAILATVKYADADQCEEKLGAFWDSSGRQALLDEQ